MIEESHRSIAHIPGGRVRVKLGGILYHLGRTIVDLYARLMFNRDVVWEAPLPPGPKIIAPNHPTTTDPFLITALLSEPTSVLIKGKLFKVPLFGRYLKHVGHVPVVCGQGRAAFEAARRVLEIGKNVLIFPEGAISPSEGGFHRPHTGAARLALITGAPIVPVGIHLDRRRIRLTETMVEGRPELGTWYLGGPYAMTVGRPMYLRGAVNDREHVRVLSAQIMRRIAQLARRSRRRLERPRTFGSWSTPSLLALTRLLGERLHWLVRQGLPRILAYGGFAYRRIPVVSSWFWYQRRR